MFARAATIHHGHLPADEAPLRPSFSCPSQRTKRPCAFLLCALLLPPIPPARAGRDRAGPRASSHTLGCARKQQQQRADPDAPVTAPRLLSHRDRPPQCVSALLRSSQFGAIAGGGCIVDYARACSCGCAGWFGANAAGCFGGYAPACGGGLGGYIGANAAGCFGGYAPAYGGGLGAGSAQTRQAISAATRPPTAVAISAATRPPASGASPASSARTRGGRHRQLRRTEVVAGVFLENQQIMMEQMIMCCSHF